MPTRRHRPAGDAPARRRPGPPPPVPATVRRWWRRRRAHPVLRRAHRRRVLAALVAVAVGATVAQAVQGAAAVRSAWGRTRPVVVASRDLPAGRAVTAGDLRVVRRPAAVVPATALRSPPVGRRLLAPVDAGEVLTPTRLAGRPGGAVAVRIGPGRAAVAVAVGAAAPPVAPGDRVDVWASGADPLDGTATGPARRVATGATVVDRRAAAPGADGGTVVLSVARSGAGPVATAALAGPVALVVVP